MKGTAGRSAFAYVRQRELSGRRPQLRRNQHTHRRRNPIALGASFKNKCDLYTHSVDFLKGAAHHYPGGTNSKKWNKELNMAMRKKAWYCSEGPLPWGKPSWKGSSKKRAIVIPD